MDGFKDKGKKWTQLQANAIYFPTYNCQCHISNCELGQFFKNCNNCWGVFVAMTMKVA